MVLPDLSVLLAALLGAALGAAVLLVIIGIRGVPDRPGKPLSRTIRLLVTLRSPQVGVRVAAGAGVFAATLVVTGWPVAAAGLAALVLAWPVLFGGNRAEQQQIARLEALVVWTEALRDTIAAHASLEQAIPATAGNASPIIRPALVRLVGQLQARVPLDRALLNLAAELDDASADLVVAALILNVRRRGDRLGEVLTGLATAAREELDMRRRVSAGRAEIRRGVQIVVLITIGFAVFLVLFGGAYVAPYSTPAGQVALLVVIGMFAAGFAWMRRLSGAAPAEPFLSRPGRPVDPEQTRLVASLTGLPAPGATSATVPGVRRSTGGAGAGR
jgi:tight adherence protein B